MLAWRCWGNVEVGLVGDVVVSFCVVVGISDFVLPSG